MIVRSILLTLSILASSSSFSAVACRVTNDKPSADAVFKSGKFRVFYTKNPASPDYLAIQTDVNKNNIPDYVENIAIQANASAEAFSLLGFVHPLDSDRYRGTVHFIDFHIVAMTANGVAFESPAYAHPSITLKEGKCGLLINLRNNITDFPGNWSLVSHELFHLYEYGYNQFKRPWYLEGMANWAERIVKGGGQGTDGLALLPQKQLKPIPPATSVLSDYEQLRTSVYNGDNRLLWSRLAVLSDTTNGQLNLPSTLLNRTYVDGTTKVFKDQYLRGVPFMKKVLENLKVESDAMSYQYGRNKDNWIEADQINEVVNFPIMTKAIQKTMHQFGMNKTIEEKSFLSFYP